MRRRRLRRIGAGACLATPVVALLWVPWYAHEGPRLAGLPFFYWYQFVWVPVSVLLMVAAYLLIRTPPRNGGPP